MSKNKIFKEVTVVEQREVVEYVCDGCGFATVLLPEECEGFNPLPPDWSMFQASYAKQRFDFCLECTEKVFGTLGIPQEIKEDT